MAQIESQKIIYSKNEKKYMEMLMELENYADLEGTELGETCQALIHMARYRDYVSDKFTRALKGEIRKQLDNFKENTRIVTTEHSVTHKMQELEWVY